MSNMSNFETPLGVFTVVDKKAREDVERVNTSLTDLAYGETYGGKNIFNAINFGYYNENGNIVSSSNYVCGDKTPFDGSTIYASTNQAHPELNSNKGIWVGIVSYDSNKQFIANSYRSVYMGSNLSINVNLASGTKFVGISTNVNVNLCLSKENISYVPYIPSVKMLEEENASLNSNLTALEYEGWTVPDGMTIKDSKLVGRVDMGDLTWYKQSTSSSNWRFYANLSSLNFKEGSTNAYMDAYDLSTSTWSGVKGYQMSGVQVTVCDLAISSESAFKESVKGKYFYFELATAKNYSDGQQAVSKINESLADYGFDNKFDGEFWRKSYNKGWIDSTTWIATKNKIPCSANSVIRAKFNKVWSGAYIIFFDSSDNDISSVGSVTLNKDELSGIAPSGTAYAMIQLEEKTSPSLNTKMNVYVNNAIDSLKSDLSGLKLKRFTGTTPAVNVAYQQAVDDITSTAFLIGLRFQHTNGNWYQVNEGFMQNNSLRFTNTSADFANRPFEAYIGYI